MAKNRAKNLRILAAAGIYLAAFLLTYTLAASMQLPTIPAIGGGEAEIVAPANVTSITWVMSSSPPWKVVGVELTFDNYLPAGTGIFVEVYQKVGGSYQMVAYGSTTLNSDLAQGTPVTVYFDSPQPASKLDKISVTVVATYTIP